MLHLKIITLVDIISIHRLIVVPNQMDVEPQGHTTIAVLVGFAGNLQTEVQSVLTRCSMFCLENLLSSEFYALS